MRFNQKFVSYRLILAGIISLFACTAIMYSCSRPKAPSGTSWAKLPANHAFVGDEACQSCHTEEAATWQDSHHDYAMAEASEESVRGDFGNVTFTHQGERYRFFQSDSLYLVEAPGPDGNSVTYQVTYTFGWEPLQQYLLDFGQGKLQALNIAWDTEKGKWFVLNPNENVTHGDWLHWTGGAMNWNTMCADCHSTNLRQNYIAEADSFHTSWSSINVSCEACHGPGKDHVRFVKSEEGARASIERIRRDLKLTNGTSQIEQISQCAQCHSLREELTGSYEHQGDYLDHYNPTLPHPPGYYPDGQIEGEVYVYGSFLQSKMFQKGVKCSDCHDPHSLKLKANVTDNSLCMQCHEPSYNTPGHFKHKVNTEASQCINCHMPGRYYMEVDFRRDHSFRVPRPDLSAEYGTPNACNSCHEDQSAEWAAEAVERWHGPERPPHFSEVLLKADASGEESLPDLERLTADTTQPEIARATAAWYAGQFPSEAASDLLGKALNDDSDLVRAAAASAMAGLPLDMRWIVLQDALDDSVRAVRLAAAEGLAELSVADVSFNLKKHYKKAFEEYRRQLNVNRYFPQGQMNRGQFFEQQGEPAKAIEAYRQVLETDPQFNPARMNLAYLYNSQNRNNEAEELLRVVTEQEPSYGAAWYSLGLLLAEQKRLDEAISYFKQAARFMPDNARLHYNFAVAQQTLNRPEEAEEQYKSAIQLAPDNTDYRYGICTLYLQQKTYRKALKHAQKLVELQPGNSRFHEVLKMIEDRAAN